MIVDDIRSRQQNSLEVTSVTFDFAFCSLVQQLDVPAFSGRPFVKRFALSYRTVVCLSYAVLSIMSVTLVYSGQTVGWIKIKLVMGVGLGSGDNVLDGDPSPPPQTGTAPNFRPISVVAKRLDIDQDATW